MLPCCMVAVKAGQQAVGSEQASHAGLVHAGMGHTRNGLLKLKSSRKSALANQFCCQRQSLVLAGLGNKTGHAFGLSHRRTGPTPSCTTTVAGSPLGTKIKPQQHPINSRKRLPSADASNKQFCGVNVPSGIRQQNRSRLWSESPPRWADPTLHCRGGWKPPRH